MDICGKGRCVNLEGSFTCECNGGYRLDTNNLVCQGLYGYIGFVASSVLDNISAESL